MHKTPNQQKEAAVDHYRKGSYSRGSIVSLSAASPTLVQNIPLTKLKIEGPKKPKCFEKTLPLRGSTPKHCAGLGK